MSGTQQGVLLSELIHLGHILSEHLLPGDLRQWRHQALEGGDILIAMIRMGEIRSPEEAIRSHHLDNLGQRFFIGISRNPALAPEVGAREVFQLR